jgi:hypothetical protein
MKQLKRKGKCYRASHGKDKLVEFYTGLSIQTVDLYSCLCQDSPRRIYQNLDVVYLNKVAWLSSKYPSFRQSHEPFFLTQ